MKNVLVALWSYRSYGHYGTAPMAVMSSFTKRVQTTATQLAASKDIETSNPFQAIFIAPEYLFVGKRDTIRRGVMFSKDRDEVVAGLKGLSKANPKILIIGGSTFWAESLDTEEQQKKYRANVVAAVMKKTDFGKDKNARALTGFVNNQNGMAVPGLNELAGVTPDYRAYNTVYAFLNGESAFAPYNKECDFFESKGVDPEQLAYVPGSAGGLREVGKFNFGVEVCFDHANNTLKGKKADFHVIVSDCVETKPNQNIGGYLLHASSDCTNTGVWKSGTSTRLTAVNDQVPSDDSLTYWLVPIEARP